MNEQHPGGRDLLRPVPVPDDLSRGFWEASARGELAIQRCGGCRTFQHPPRALCRACGNTTVAFEQVSGTGRLWSWTVTYRSVLSSFEAALPYTSVIVELAEQAGLFLLSDLAGRDLGGTLTFGMPLRVIFPQTREGPVLPQFVVDDREGSA